VIYSVVGDSTPTSRQDEETRIAPHRQVAASYYYGEIAERGVDGVLSAKKHPGGEDLGPSKQEGRILQGDACRAGTNGRQGHAPVGVTFVCSYRCSDSPGRLRAEPGAGNGLVLEDWDLLRLDGSGAAVTARAAEQV
jgi:hypothetical protein